MNDLFSYYRSASGSHAKAGPDKTRADDGSLWSLADAKTWPSPRSLRSRAWGLWRYREVLPDAPEYYVGLGEGGTPLVPLTLGRVRFDAKVEYMSPTGSFKDRGAAVMLAVAASWGVDRCAVDSSGNAAAAVAAYAAFFGMRCDVFVPAANSPLKLAQPAMHGAEVHRIDGSRADVAAAAMAFVDGSDAFYASHVYCPFFYEGTKTYAYEIWEQLGGRAPDSILLPVGNGTLVLGAAKGFRELRAAGCIDRLPRIVAVQAAACAPLAYAWENGSETVYGCDAEETAAEGIAIAAPPRGDEILRVVRETDGEIMTVSDSAVRDARARLARRGLFVETTAAVPAAALLQRTDLCGDGRRVVVPLCGSGLKGG
jgi:threonine synthase